MKWPVLVALSLMLPAAAGLAQNPPETSATPICHTCFWEHQPAELRRNLTEAYRQFACSTFLCRAEVTYLLGTMTEQEQLIRDSIAFYDFSLQHEAGPDQTLLLNEILGILAPHARLDSKPYFETAAKLAADAGLTARSRLLSSLARGEAFAPQFESIEIRKSLRVPRNARFFVLGESVIKVPRGARVAVQLERTFRDWLSFQYGYDFTSQFLSADHVLDYHEGARLRDLMRLADVKPIAVSGTLLARTDGRWYAPDENGVFRFQVLNDKVQYPTVKQWGDLAIMTDTHGVSALVEQSINGRADLVLACGDNAGKTDAAYYLATKGIDVYFPCDREVGLVLGYDAPGVLLGTAPIHKIGSDVVIGGQPVWFALDEVIVVSGIVKDSDARYYDAPFRYFSALAKLLPIKVVMVPVEGVGEARKIVAEAQRLGATAIGIRVAYESDYDAVKAWLAKSPRNRAVLFHSAPYQPGYRLFAEFTKQVTFGDPRPRFRDTNGRAVTSGK